MQVRDKLKSAVSVEGKVSKRKLFAKLFVTLVAALWVLIYLGVMLVLSTPLLNYFESEGASSTTLWVVSIWFLFTVVVSASLIVHRVYSSVLGEWSSKDENSKD